MKAAGSRIKSFAPSASRESYKDLLIFEERLKQNAERLQAQRQKYELFLFSMVALVLYLAYVVFIHPSIYSLVHYGHVVSFLVSLVTIILFFATGLYSEKIVYAYKFVPQANRALRPFNIYLNTRTRSRITKITSSLRLSSTSQVRPTPPPLVIPTRPRSLSETSSASSTRSSNSKLGKSPPVSPVSRAPSLPIPPAIQSQPRGVPLAPIPPPINPRGELIFSSRVSPGFREGYERYRGEWERRRNPGNQKGWLAWLFKKSSTSGKEKDGMESDVVPGHSSRGRESRSASLSTRGSSPFLGRNRSSPNSSISSTRTPTPSNDLESEGSTILPPSLIPPSPLQATLLLQSKIEIELLPGPSGDALGNG